MCVCVCDILLSLCVEWREALVLRDEGKPGSGWRGGGMSEGRGKETKAFSNVLWG